MPVWWLVWQNYQSLNTSGWRVEISFWGGSSNEVVILYLDLGLYQKVELLKKLTWRVILKFCKPIFTCYHYPTTLIPNRRACCHILLFLEVASKDIFNF